MARHVSDVMQREPLTVEPHATFKDVARLMAGSRLSALPVIDDGGRVVGVVSEADLIVRDESFTRPHLLEGRATRLSHRKAHALTARGLMTAPAVVVPPDASLAEAATLMRRCRIKCLPVCDPDGMLLGLVSRLDLVHEFLRDDAEIARDVAEILQHELSIPEHEVRAVVTDGVVVLEGRVERRSQVPPVVDRVRRVPGTIEVVGRLTWAEDDTLVELGPLPSIGL